jgi:UDP-N-acetylmuramoylalanine--D-glutamate ligase
MARALASAQVRTVYLIGAAAAMLAEAIAGIPSPPLVVQAGTLEKAVADAWEAASAGEAILLSPGCESFDQFADYRQRGDLFCALVEALPARAREGMPR